MTGENRLWSEVYYEAAQDWVDKEAAAALLEDTKSSMLAQWEIELGDIPVNRATQITKASARWGAHIRKIIEARRVANLAKCQVEYIKMRANEWNNEEANHRAGARL